MKYILLILLALTATFSYGAEYQVINDLSFAQQQAEKTNTKLLVIFSADWCKYCTLLQNAIEKNIDIISEKYTICYIDFDTNKELVNKYKVQKIPYSIVIEKNTRKNLLGFTDYNSYRLWLGL